MSRKQLCLPPGNKMVVRKLRGMRSSRLDELSVCWALLQLKAAGSEYLVWDAGSDRHAIFAHPSALFAGKDSGEQSVLPLEEASRLSAAPFSPNLL